VFLAAAALPCGVGLLALAQARCPPRIRRA